MQPDTTTQSDILADKEEAQTKLCVLCMAVVKREEYDDHLKSHGYETLAHAVKANPGHDV